MLPSSSSQLAKYGQINHYKKFWLLQTQLEMQEQSSSSSTLSLGNTSAAVPTGHVFKESTKSSSSLVAHHVSGDIHHAGFMAPQYGICRVDNMTSSSSSNNCSGRVINGGSSMAYCPNEPACVSSYFTNIPRYGLQPTNASTRVDAEGPRLSLAVNCENVSDAIKFANCKQYSSSSSQPHSNEQQQVLERLGAVEPELSESFIQEDKRVCNGATPHTLLSASSDHLRMGDQPHAVSGFPCRNPPLLLNTTSVLGPPPSGYLRTCTLCGTTRTPLWRSGPDGPKSLCNACGIRVKKTKRLEAALQATSGSSPSPSTMSAIKGALKRKLSSETQKDPTFHKKKRSTSFFISPNRVKQEFVGHNKKAGGLWDNGSSKLALLSESGRSANILAEDVEEAAVLLMALSCGLVLS